MPTSNELQAIAQSCLQTIDLVIETPINAESASAVGGETRSDFAGRLTNRGCGVAVAVTRRARIHRRGIGNARGMTDVPRTSLGAGTRWPVSGPRLPSCWVCRPKSIALTHPVASLFLPAPPLPSCATLLSPVWSAVGCAHAGSRRAKPTEGRRRLVWHACKPSRSHLRVSRAARNFG